MENFNNFTTFNVIFIVFVVEIKHYHNLTEFIERDEIYL